MRERLRALARGWPGRIALGFAVSVGLMLILLRTGVGMETVIPWALSRGLPDGWTVEVDRVSGRWDSTVRLEGLRLEAPGGSAEVRSVLVDYGLPAVLRRTVDLHEVALRGVRIDWTMAASGAETAEGSSPPAAPSVLTESPLGAWTLELGRAWVEDVRADLSVDGQAYRILEAAGSMRARLSPDTVRFGLDSLHMRVEPPATADGPAATVGTLAAAGSAVDGRVTVQRLSFHSGRSDLRGSGGLVLAREGLFEGADFALRASPLDLRDLPLVLPAGFRAQPTTRFELAVTGTADSLRVEGDLAGPDSIAAAVDVTLRDLLAREARAEPVPALRGSLTFQGVRPAAFVDAPAAAGVVEGELDVTLAELSSTTGLVLDGSLRRRPDSDAPDPPPDLIRAPLSAALRVRRDADAADAGSPLEATLGVERGLPGGDWVELGELRASVQGAEAEWTLAAGLDDARIDGQGSLAWGDTLSAVLRRLDIVDLDLQRLLDDAPASSISASVSGRVRGPSAEALTGSLHGRVAASTVGDIRVDTVTVVADVGRRRVDGRGRVDLRGYRIETRYSVDRATEVLRGRLDSLRVTSLDSVPGTTPIEVRASARGSWRGDVETGTGRLTAALDSGAVASVVLQSAGVQAEYVAGATAGSFSAVLVDPSGQAVDLTGDVDVTGTTLEALLGDASVTAVRARRGLPAADTVRASVRAEDVGQFALTGLVRPADGGAVRLEGRVRTDSTAVPVSFAARGGLPEPVALLGGTSADSVDVTASVVLDEGRWADGRVAIDVTGATRGGLRLDSARVVVTGSTHRVVLDTLRARSNVAELSGSGRLPGAGSAPDSIVVTGRLIDIEPLRELLGADLLAAGDGRARLSLAGDMGRARLTGEASLVGAVIDDVRVTGVRTEAEADLRLVAASPTDSTGTDAPGPGLDGGRALLTLDRILLPAAEVRSIEIRAAGGPDSLRVDGTALVDDARRADLSALIDPRPERRTARIDRFDLQLDEDRWGLSGPSTLSLRDGVALRSFELVAGGQSIEIDGGVTGAGALDLTLQVDSTDVGTLSDLAGFPALDGWVRGRATLGGRIDAVQGEMRLSGGVHRRGATPGPFRIAADLEPGRVSMEGTIEGAGSGTVSVRGDGPFRGFVRPEDAASGSVAGDSLTVRVRADAFEIGWAAPFLDPETVGGLSGLLDGEITGRGSAADPVFSGDLGLRNGRVDLPSLGVRWDDIRLDARGGNGEIVVDSARARSGSGTVAAAGTIQVREGLPVDLDVSFAGFRAIDNRQYAATLGGGLEVGGTLVEPQISGDVELQSLDVHLDEQMTAQGIEDVELTDADLLMLRERFGVIPAREEPGAELVDRVRADVHVRLGRDSWLRKRASPEMAVAFTGEVDVVLRPGEEPRVDGTVTTIADRGFVEQFGRRFNLREGTVNFAGPASSAEVDLTAVYTIPARDDPRNAEATIILEIQGTQESLSLVLSSDPPMENADIVSYIATGRPATSALAFGESGSEGGLVAAGTDLALEQITGVIEGAAARSVGLDVVEIRREGLREATLVAGKYVSPRLYIGFAQPLLRGGEDLAVAGTGGSEVEIELQALQWLLLNVEGSGSAIRLFLRGRHAY